MNSHILRCEESSVANDVKFMYVYFFADKLPGFQFVWIFECFNAMGCEVPWFSSKIKGVSPAIRGKFQIF